MIKVFLVASDPEWLPSTIVQSSAALVAIIGGLLVARLVGMTAERRSIRTRLEELNDLITSDEIYYRDLVAERFDWDLSDFIDSAVIAYFPDRLMTARDLVSEVSSDAALEQRREFARIFFDWIAENEPRIEALFDDGARYSEDLRRRGLDVEPKFEPVAEALLSGLDPPTPTFIGGLNVSIPTIPLGPLDPAGRIVTSQRWDALNRDIERTDRKLQERIRERDRLIVRVSELTPHGVRGSLLTLGGVVLAGIAFPIVVMALRPPDLSPGLRWAMVAAFLVSVGVVAIHTYSLAVSRDQPSEAESSDLKTP